MVRMPGSWLSYSAAIFSSRKAMPPIWLSRRRTRYDVALPFSVMTTLPVRVAVGTRSRRMVRSLTPQDLLVDFAFMDRVPCNRGSRFTGPVVWFRHDRPTFRISPGNRISLGNVEDGCGPGPTIALGPCRAGAVLAVLAFGVLFLALAGHEGNDLHTMLALADLAPRASQAL